MQQQQMLNQTGGNNLLQMQQFRMGAMPNGMNNMQKVALQNNRPGYVASKSPVYNLCTSTYLNADRPMPL